MATNMFCAYIPGTYTDNQILVEWTPSYITTLPLPLSGNSVHTGTGIVATNPSVIHMKLNGDIISTATIAAGGNIGAFSVLGSFTTILTTDVLSFVGPSPPDPTLADLRITIPISF